MSVWLRRTLWVFGTLVLSLLIIFILISYVLDEPLRAYLERQVNEPLQGYVVTLEDVDVNPLVLTIIKNAFFQAILPGFEGEISESE